MWGESVGSRATVQMEGSSLDLSVVIDYLHTIHK